MNFHAHSLISLFFFFFFFFFFAFHFPLSNPLYIRLFFFYCTYFLWCVLSIIIIIIIIYKLRKNRSVRTTRLARSRSPIISGAAYVISNSTRTCANKNVNVNLQSAHTPLRARTQAGYQAAWEGKSGLVSTACACAKSPKIFVISLTLGNYRNTILYTRP